MSERIKGVMAAGLTAFNNDLTIDVQGTIAHSRWLLANGCDGVLLDLHGAMVAEHLEDGEGELLRRVRAVAPGVPIGVALDMHANLSDTIALFERGQTAIAAAYVAGSVILSLAGIVAGLAAARELFA